MNQFQTTPFLYGISPYRCHCITGHISWVQLLLSCLGTNLSLLLLHPSARGEIPGFSCIWRLRHWKIGNDSELAVPHSTLKRFIKNSSFHYFFHLWSIGYMVDRFLRVELKCHFLILKIALPLGQHFCLFFSFLMRKSDTEFKDRAPSWSIVKAWTKIWTKVFLSINQLSVSDNLCFLCESMTGTSLVVIKIFIISANHGKLWQHQVPLWPSPHKQIATARAATVNTTTWSTGKERVSF